MEADALLTIKLLPAQIVASGPAFTIEVLEIVRSISSEAILLQGGLPLAVNVNVTDPPAMSPALGV